MKKRFCILLAMMMVICLLPMSTTAASAVWDGTIATAYAGGTGTQAAPYQIANGEQLAYFAQQVNAGTSYADQYFVLTDNIVLNDTTDWETWSGTVSPTNTWTPIGTDYNTSFAGTFDGGNHTISGIYVNVTGSIAGLFGIASNTSTIKNLGVLDSYVYSSNDYGYAGSIVTSYDGTVQNCYNMGTVEGYRAGGISADTYEGSITGCWNMGDIIGTECAGGIMAYVSGSPSFEMCSNWGEVTASGENGYAGGIAGNNNTTSIITNSYNGGSISSVSGYAGGIAGFSIFVSNNCYNVGAVTGATNKTGLIAGRAYVPNDSTYANTYYLDDATSLVGVGENIDTSVYPATTTYNVNPTGTAPLTDAQMRVQANFTNWDFDNVWTMEGDPDYLYPELRSLTGVPHSVTDPAPASTVWDGTSATGFDSGTGTELDPYIIMTPEQLAYFRDQVNGGRSFDGEYVRVGANLVLNDTTNWQSWSGTVAPTNAWTPIGTRNYPFAGTFDGASYTISGMYVNAIEYAGLLGYSTESSIIKNIGINDSYITDGGNAGAIIGYLSGAISNCYNTGTVIGDCAGGIVGYTNATGVNISNCCNAGAITGGEAGGILGFARAGTSLEYCYNRGAVTTNDEQGNAGGICGTLYRNATLRNSFNVGTIFALQHNAGGLIGQANGSIENSYNAGTVTGTANMIGLIAGRAYNLGSLSFSNTYYLDDATSLAAVGEYYDSSTNPATTTNNVNPTGTAPLTDAQMRVQSSFTNWDFTNVWTMEGNPEYPYPELRGMPAPTLPEPPVDPDPQPIALTVVTLGGAARLDKTAIRFGASISFADMAALNVGDTVDYGFSINGLSGDALTSANWTKLSAASTTVNFAGFEWTAAMDEATTTEALTALIRATGIKVYSYDANTITFAIILNNLPMAAQDSLWVFEPYVTINATDTSLGTAKYNSINRILEDIASGTYVA